MSFEEKSKWLSQNPVTAARHFQYRLNTFVQKFLKSKAHPLGELTDYSIRVEFQARGSPHAHSMFWIKGAPKLGVNTDQEVCDFIDRYIRCDVPEDTKSWLSWCPKSRSTDTQPLAGGMSAADSAILVHQVLPH